MKNVSRKQNLLSEDINRMREIMGLIPLNEAASIDPLLPLFRLLRGTARKILKPEIAPGITQQGQKYLIYKIAGKEVTEDVYMMFNKLLNTEGDEFKNAYQAFIKRFAGETDEMFKTRIRNLLQILGEEYTTELYKEFFKSWFKKTADLFPDALKSEKAFYRWMSNAKKKAIKDGKEWNMYNWLKNKSDEGGVNLLDDELDLEGLLPTLERRLKEYDENPLNFKTEVVKKTPGKVVPLSQDRINYLKRFLKSRSSLFSTIFSNWGKTLQEYEAAVLGYMEAYADDVIKAKMLPANVQKETLDTLSAAYAQQVALILRKAKLKFGDDAIQILEDSGLPDDIIAHFRNNQDDFFKYFNEAFQGADSAIQTSVAESMFNASRQFVRTMGKFMVDFYTFKWVKIIKELLNPETNLGTWFWTNSWSGFDTLYQVAAKNALLSKNPRFAKAFAEAVIWTSVASAAGFLLRTGWETFKELGIKGPTQLIIVPLCNAIADFIPSLKYSVDPKTGEGVEGWCPLLDEISQFERQGYAAITMAIPDGIVDAWEQSVAQKGYVGIVGSALPLVAQIYGFIERIPYTLGAFRPDVKPLHNKSEEKQKELEKVTKEESNNEVDLNDINLADSSSIEADLQNQ